MKACTKYGRLKQFDDFYKVTERGRTRLRSICKDCSKAQLRDRTTDTDTKPDALECSACGVLRPIMEVHKHKYCQYGVDPMCKSCRRAKRRAYGRRYPDRIRNTDLQMRYGITLADYRAMHARQEGCCAICGTAGEKLVVDHHHGTGRVRSLLCHLCNTMLGCAREREDILARGIAYLRAAADTPAEAAG